MLLTNSHLPAVVLDCGSGYSKLGFAGNVQPSFVIPTALSLDAKNDHNLLAESYSSAPSTDVVYPIRNGQVVDWDCLEKFYQQCFFRRLRVDPQSYNFVYSEPLVFTPKDRETTAEIFFESFNAAGLLFEPSPVLALQAAGALTGQQPGQGLSPGSGTQVGSLTFSAPVSAATGVVVDVGETRTAVVPIVEGCVLGGAAKSAAAGSRDALQVVQRAIRERGEPVPTSLSAAAARHVRASACYVCLDPVRERRRWAAGPREKFFKAVRLADCVDLSSTVSLAETKDVTFEVGHERYLAPETIFNPALVAQLSGDSAAAAAAATTATLPQLVDACVQSCPMDVRRALYGNIVLSGGGSLFKNFSRRLESNVSALVQRRLAPGATPVEVTVRSHPLQAYASWFGGSRLASLPEFEASVLSRAEYLERGGPSCVMDRTFGGGNGYGFGGESGYGGGYGKGVYGGTMSNDIVMSI